MITNHREFNQLISRSIYHHSYFLYDLQLDIPCLPTCSPQLLFHLLNLYLLQPPLFFVIDLSLLHLQCDSSCLPARIPSHPRVLPFSFLPFPPLPLTLIPTLSVDALLLLSQTCAFVFIALVFPIPTAQPYLSSFPLTSLVALILNS
jgi:hypothetical protein